MPYGYPGTSNYGSAPYEESAGRKLLRALAGGLIGLGAPPQPGGNFLSGLGQGFGRSYLTARTERDAAMDYALKMEEQKRRQQQDALNSKYMEAQIEKMNRPEPPEKPTKDQEAERILGRTLNEDERKMLAGVYREPKDTTGGDEPEMSDAALRIAARVYLKTGQLPSMGMGKSGVKNRTRILNMASEMSPGANVADNTASFRAGQRALSDLNLQKNRLESFENTAAENTKIIWDFVNKVPDTGTRFGNKWSRWLANQTGNPDVAAFTAAVNVVMNEYARIVTQFGGTNVMTDTARKEMERIISGDYTKKQLVSVLRTIQRDAANRLMSTDRQIKQIEGDIGGIGGDSAPADLIYNPQTGELEPAR